MKHTQRKFNEMKRHMRLLAILLVPVVALILGASAPGVWADEPECWFNIEFNATDLDVGVRGFFDYEPWNALTITDPIVPPATTGNMIADVKALSSLADQGFAEWFFESGEPMLGEDDYTFAVFEARFPPGDYVFDAVPNDGLDVSCTAVFTHVIPCAPEISVAGNRGLGVTISWDPVTTVVDTVATDDKGEVVCEEGSVDIVGYEVIVETEVDGEEKEYKIDLPADATSVHVPPEFIALDDEFQYEVLAIEASGNQTITEEDFCMNERNGHVEECPDEDE